MYGDGLQLCSTKWKNKVEVFAMEKLLQGKDTVYTVEKYIHKIIKPLPYAGSQVKSLL